MRVVSTLVLALSGFLLLPVLAFTFGQAVVGPYEGDAGFADFLGAIVADLWRGKLGAFTLVATPAAIVAIWYAAIHVMRRILRSEVANAAAERPANS